MPRVKYKEHDELYIVMMVAIYFIVGLYYKIIIDSLWLKIIIFSVFYWLSYKSIYAFYMADNPREGLLLLTLLLGVFIAIQPLIGLPILILSFSVFSSKNKISTKVIGFILIVLLLFSFSIGIIFSEYGIFPLKVPREVTDRVVGPNPTYAYIVEFVDEGALGRQKYYI